MLGDEVVVAVVADVAGRVGEHDGVVAWDEAAEVRHHDLDDEAAAGLQVGGSVVKHVTCRSWVSTFPIVL